jgi:hypothetical protein
MNNIFKLLVRHYPNDALAKFEEVSYLLKNSDSINIEKFLRIKDIRNYKEEA